ncbi:MAG: L,D-transpeptidase family protein [Coriobacteriales bacterium]|nr:L,D-transpeptidase family protein [Coriobacteriales bacterium]
MSKVNFYTKVLFIFCVTTLFSLAFVLGFTQTSALALETEADNEFFADVQNADEDAINLDDETNDSSEISDDSLLTLPVGVPETGQYWYKEGSNYSFYKDGELQTGLIETDLKLNNTIGVYHKYWIDSSTQHLVFNQLIGPINYEGNTFYAYATSGGYFLSAAKYRISSTGYFYVANSDGWLLSGVTKTCEIDGSQQVYVVDENLHVVIPGYVVFAGKLYYNRSDLAYAVKGIYYTGDGHALIADNNGVMLQGFQTIGGHIYYLDEDGRTVAGLFTVNGFWYFGIHENNKCYLAVGKYRDPSTGYFYLANSKGALEDPGWLTTSAYDGHSELYYIDPDKHAIIPGLSNDEYLHYVRPDNGRVVRGVYGVTSTRAYLADSTGHILDPGWHVTGDFTGGVLQRYYVEEDHLTSAEFFTVSGNRYYSIPGYYFVLRGKLYVVYNGVGRFLLADNGGVMPSFAGMLVSAIYDGHNERYYLDSAQKSGYFGCVLGFISFGGHLYYGREDTGYVYRNCYFSSGGHNYWADGDGILEEIFHKFNDMYRWAQGYNSPTDYLILVDTPSCRIGIYEWSYGAGEWVAVKEWYCSPGAYSSPTATGTFYIQDRGYSFGTSSYTCYYWTQFYGNYLFHSVLYYPGGGIKDGRIGEHLSHGCVRLDIDNAHWIYNNIPRGTKVVIW